MEPAFPALPAIVVTHLAPPLPLVCPLVPPLAIPSRRPLVVPLLPVVGASAIVPGRHEQQRPGHEVGSNEHPRTTVHGAHVPAAVGEGPVLAAIEEQVH